MADAQENNAQAPLIPPGTMVDHYKVIRQIGRGGMGEVYLARDTTLGRRVALKVVIASGLRHAEARDRFLREARLTARFNHPHIITVYGVGQYDGMPYVALEFLEGENLAKRLQDEPPGVKRGLRVALAVAEGLAEAHGHDVLHRDLKPENVFIPRDGRIRVLDFGMAKRVEGAPSTEQRPAAEAAAVKDAAVSDAESAAVDNLFQTQALGIQGTPLYMAPEQWFQMAGPAADVWSLGMILRELFTRTHPFEGLDLNAVWAAASDEKPLPSLATVGTNLPPALVDLADACLLKKAEDRPTAAEVVQRLKELLADVERHPTVDESPFRGLLPFHERHAHLFFGRSEEVAAFIERLRQTPVLPVVGPSGAGKSSFVQAGVVARLREHGRWLVIRMRPGSTPFQTLANRIYSADSETLQLPDFTGDVSGPVRRTSMASLSPSARDTRTDTPPPVQAPRQTPDGLGSAATQLLAERDPAQSTTSDTPPPKTDASDVAATLLRYPQRLALTLAELAEAENCRVMLLVDQLEELYTLVPDEAVRRAFMQAVCTAVDDPTSPVRVVFTLRDDFLWRLAEGPEAREVLGHVYVLRPPDTEALVETLTEPLATLGYAYEDDELPREMVAEVRDEPAALPLLQFAAEQLWRERDREARRFTRQAYRATGGVAGALARHADGVLSGLAPPQVDVARRLFLRLVTPESTRQVCAHSELIEGLGPDSKDVLERLTRERIVLTRKGRQEAELELVHESLIRTWRRLARWLEESREEHAFLDEIGQAAALWQKRGRSAQEVWHGGALADAQRQADRCATLPGIVRDFLEAGRRREVGRVRRRQLLLALGGAALALIAIVAVVVSLALRSREQETRQQRDRAQHQQTEAQRQRTEALREGARSALLRGAYIEAKAKLRGALEARDSTLARALWWRLSRSPLQWMKTLSSHLYGVSFAPNGRSMAVSSLGQTVHIIDLITGRDRVLRGHRDQVYRVTYSPDGRLLASGTWNGEVILWNAATGKARPIARTRGGGWGLAFSPDGRTLASGGSAAHVTLFDVATGKEIARLSGHKKSIYAVAYSPDGRLIASASSDKTIRLWDAATNRSVALLKGHRTLVTRVAFSPDGRLLASASSDRTARLWTVADGRLRAELKGHQASVYGLAFSPDGQLLATSGHDRLILLWRVSDAQRVGRFEGHTARIWEVAFSPDGQLLASVAADRQVRLWKVARAVKHTALPGNTSSVMGVAFGPDGKTLASAGQDHVVRLWDVARGIVLASFSGHTAPLRGVAYDRQNRRLVSGSDDRTVRIWDLATRKIAVVLRGHTAPTYGGIFSHDGRRVYSGSSDRTIRVWDAATGRSLAVLRGHESPVVAIDLSPDGRQLASTSTNGSVRLWDVETGRNVATLRGHTDSVDGVAFSPDGRYLASTSGDKTLRLWNLKTSTPIVLGRHPSRAYLVAFHPSGRYVATSCADGIARIWDRTTRKALPLRGHRGEVNYVAYSPDGRNLVTTGDDHTVRLWNAQTGEPVWRSPLLLETPLELYSHRGWIRLDASAKPAPSPVPSPSTPRSARWRRAVERQARLAHATPDGRRLCLLTHDGDLQQWDTGGDRRVGKRARRAKLQKVTRLVALWKGCATLEGDKLRYHPAKGTVRTLSQGVTAVSTLKGELLAATDQKILLFKSQGRLTHTYPGAGGVTALARVQRWIAVGYKDGGMQLLATDPRVAAPRLTFAATPASPVVSLAEGPRSTLVAGYGNGAFGIWSVTNGAQLTMDRLHGPAVHLVLRRQMLYAASTLGEYRSVDLSIFHTPYCELLRSVWEAVRFEWRGGVPRRAGPPVKHQCWLDSQ